MLRIVGKTSLLDELAELSVFQSSPGRNLSVRKTLLGATAPVLTGGSVTLLTPRTELVAAGALNMEGTLAAPDGIAKMFGFVVLTEWNARGVMTGWGVNTGAVFCAPPWAKLLVVPRKNEPARLIDESRRAVFVISGII
jgi:hypothetical protein